MENIPHKRNEIAEDSSRTAISQEKRSGSERKDNFDGAKLLGGLAILGLGAFAIKKGWDAKGPEIKQKLGDAASRIIDSCISRGEAKMAEALGFDSKPKAGSRSSTEQSQDLNKPFFDEEEIRNMKPEQKREAKSFASGDVVDVEFEMVNDQAEFSLDFDSMNDDQVMDVFKKVQEDPSIRQDFFAIFLKESKDMIRDRSIFTMSKEEQMKATRQSLKKFSSQKTGSGGENKSNKAFRNLTSLMKEI